MGRKNSMLPGRLATRLPSVRPPIHPLHHTSRPCHATPQGPPEPCPTSKRTCHGPPLPLLAAHRSKVLLATIRITGLGLHEARDPANVDDQPADLAHLDDKVKEGEVCSDSGVQGRCPFHPVHSASASGLLAPRPLAITRLWFECRALETGLVVSQFSQSQG